MTTYWSRPLLCVWLALLANGCGGVVDPSKNQIEEISGILEPLKLNVHEFTASRNGEFEVKITKLTPNPDAFLSLAYGPFQNGCGGTFQTNQFAQLNKIGLGGPITSGRFCLFVSDVGTLSQPANYTLRVSRP